MAMRVEPAGAARNGMSIVGAREARAGAGLCLVLLGASFLTVTMVAASIAPAYDYHGAAISDLGVIDETAVVFNVQLVATGVLNIAAGALLWLNERRWWLLVPFLLGGIGAIGAGLVPLDRSDLHSLFALIGFVFFNLEAIAAAVIVRGPMRPISLAAGIIGLAYVAVMIVGDGGNPAIFGALGHGGTERMIVFPAMLWAVAFGGHQMAGEWPRTRDFRRGSERHVHRVT